LQFNLYGLHVSVRRDGSEVDPAHRSVHPHVRGVPWWGAVLIAFTSTAIGFAYDAGGGDKLTNVFYGMYVIGCVAAVLMVRQAAVFTAVVQPPILLFIAVPGANYVLHDVKLTDLKGVVINCAYPLIERFPLMILTSGAVLLIGLARWYFGGRSAREEEAVASEEPSRLGTLTSKLNGILSPKDEEGEEPKRRHAIDRPKSRTTKAATSSTPAERRRTRHLLEDGDGATERPRRRSLPTDDVPDVPRRRSRAASTGRDPFERRERYERREPHDRRSRHDSSDPSEAYEMPARRRPGTNGATVTNGTHHPISRVRYRGSATEPRQEHAGRTRARAYEPSYEADRWEYDI
jgi:hypothetical protein